MTPNVSEELDRALAEARAVVRTSFPWWLRPFLLRGVVAITIGRRIYVRSELPVASCQLPDDSAGNRRPATGNSIEPLLWHEVTHVRQMTEAGLLRFGWRYVREYVRNARAGMTSSEAYRNISFEREAFAAERVHKNVDV